MTAFLIDEMFPAAAAQRLREKYDRDAVYVSEVGLLAAADADVASFARVEGHAIVTENMVDFAGERDLLALFVLKKDLASGCGQAAALAAILDRWAAQTPGPYLGHHWP